MDQKNIETILEALVEKIRDLELEVSLRDYDIKKLKEENEKLKKAAEYFEQALLKEEE
jgi:hypothetical protein